MIGLGQVVRLARSIAAGALGAGMLAGALGVAGVAGVAGAAVHGSPPPDPLASSWATAQGSWAIVPMGRLHQTANTFWQVLFRGAAAGRWSLVTPPGVATNGGLVGDSGPAGTVTVGVEPSRYLRYSPVSRTGDGGASWSPGVLPSGLLDVPDAVATTASGAVLALVRTGGGSLVRSGATLTAWSVETTRRALASGAPGRECRVADLRAVAGVGGATLLGATCTAPGVVGIFTSAGGSAGAGTGASAGGTWRLGGPSLGGVAAGASVSVLRLVGGPSGAAALVEATRGAASWLLALWRGPSSATWRVSAPERLRGRVVATGFGPSQSVVVVTGRGHGRGEEQAVTIAGPGAPWTVLPVPPPATAAVVDGPGGFDALAVSGSRFADWHLDAASGRWRLAERARVPVEYGSST